MNKEKIQVFRKLYREFVLKCLEQDIYPVPALEKTLSTIYSYMNFIIIKPEEKPQLVKRVQSGSFNF